MQRHLERREREGLTYAELEARTGVSRKALQWWAWKLRREEQSAPAFVEVEVRADKAPSETRIEVELANGRRLAVRPGFDEETLRRAVVALERTC